MDQMTENVHDQGFLGEPMNPPAVDLAEQPTPTPVGLVPVLAHGLPLITPHSRTIVMFVGQPPLLGGTITTVTVLGQAEGLTAIERTDYIIVLPRPFIGMSETTIRALGLPGLLVRTGGDITPATIPTTMGILVAKSTAGIKTRLFVLKKLLVPCLLM
jgi:hypothetical protein